MCYVLVVLESSWIPRAGPVKQPAYRFRWKVIPSEWYPTPFIDQIIDACVGSEVFSFMDGLSGYNQIQIKPEDQHKKKFICPWGTFAYKKISFGLKNAGATF